MTGTKTRPKAARTQARGGPFEALPSIDCVLSAMVLIASLFVLLGCLAFAGCGARATPSSTSFESAFAREYERLHGATDAGTLSPEPKSENEIVAGLRAGYTGTLLLPSTLPPGFELAAPFRGTGSGAPLPNPHAWGAGYAITYTDGRGRLTVMMNPDELVEGGGWESTEQTLGKRVLLVQERGGLVLVTTDAREPARDLFVVIGERLPRAEVLRVAAGLREPDSR
ncbi:MAG: hypothetical protein KKA32_08930 [Actinobacteria bacterium]|nr:hypothetical protein [Actinomycetota bacterium]